MRTTQNKASSAPRTKEPERRTKVVEVSPNNLPEGSVPGECTILAACAGEWIDAVTLRDWAVEQFGRDAQQGPASGARQAGIRPTLVVDLEGIHYLEAGALQVLLVIAAQQRERGGGFRLAHASEELHRWFEYGGAAELLDRAQPAS